MKALTLSMVAALALTLSSQAKADGFKCLTADQSLKVQFFNHTDPSEGTRAVSTMVLSDQTVNFGNKTIAVFSSDKGTLTFSGNGQYVAKVDLRVKELKHAGEYLAGTRLGYVDQIVVNIAHAYGEQTEAGDVFPAAMTVIKRNGQKVSETLLCERYLKQ